MIEISNYIDFLFQLLPVPYLLIDISASTEF